MLLPGRMIQLKERAPGAIPTLSETQIQSPSAASGRTMRHIGPTLSRSVRARCPKMPILDRSLVLVNQRIVSASGP
jgi:hypothetical protein